MSVDVALLGEGFYCAFDCAVGVPCFAGYCFVADGGCVGAVVEVEDEGGEDEFLVGV